MRALPALRRVEKRHIVQWTPAHDAFLGQASDATLGDAWGVQDFHIWTRRTLLRVLAYHQPCSNVIRWTPAMLRLLGHISDTLLAQRFNISPSSVHMKRRSLGIARSSHTCAIAWTPAMNRLIGRNTDAVVAQQLGMAVSTVREQRTAPDPVETP